MEGTTSAALRDEFPYWPRFGVPTPTDLRRDRALAASPSSLSA